METEAERVFLWRKAELERAGYNEAQAERLAAGGCDLHLACDLITKHHAPADIAFDICSEEDE